MTLQAVVEGHGEVAALPVLLRRLLRECGGVQDVEVGKPIRQPRSALVQPEQLTRAVQLARKQEDAGAILILLDADDSCPRELGPHLQAVAVAAARPLPCAIVLANREYEAWFLGAVESLRGRRGIRDDACSVPNPEAPRDCKGRLESLMADPRRGYAETTDQVAMSALFDMVAAYHACRSFRRLVHAVDELCRCTGRKFGQWLLT